MDEKVLKAIAGMTPAEFAALMAQVAAENRALASISTKAQNLARISDASQALRPEAVKALVKAFGSGALSMRLREESKHVLSLSYHLRKARDLNSLDLSLFGSGQAGLQVRFEQGNAHVYSLSIVPAANDPTLVGWILWENVPGCRELVGDVTMEGTLADARWDHAKPTNTEKVHFNIMTSDTEAEAAGK
jgi:23S rRNA pseudoU1915 N3-methylase RlmH